MKVTIYHNPACGTSRKVLAAIHEAGIEPEVIEYLKNPPTREVLVGMIARMGIAPRELLRTTHEAYEQMNLADPSLSDDALVDAMMKEPVLINRPIVVTPKGVRLCRPAETVQELLNL